jgi:spermidine/putrescine transport system ATP-binding protein
MSDRVAVMNAGVIEQVGDGRSVYDSPRTGFVASFVGENNGFDGTVVSVDGDRAVIDTVVGKLAGRRFDELSAGAKATIYIRPEALNIAGTGTTAALLATVQSHAFEGNATQLFLKGAGDKAITVLLSRREDASDFAAGRQLGLTYAAKDAVVLPAGRS